jgi:hypothetical protein
VREHRRRSADGAAEAGIEGSAGGVPGAAVGVCIQGAHASMRVEVCDEGLSEGPRSRSGRDASGESTRGSITGVPAGASAAGADAFSGSAEAANAAEESRVDTGAKSGEPVCSGCVASSGEKGENRVGSGGGGPAGRSAACRGGKRATTTWRGAQTAHRTT